MVLLTVLAFFPIASLFIPSVCGQAVSCPHSCTIEQMPVCARHPLKGFRTFPNKCSLDEEIRCKRERWTFIHTGSCTDEERGPVPDCTLFCPAIYSPVCGYSRTTGFKTFPNQCDLDRQINCYNRDYEYIFDGKCRYEGPVTDCPRLCSMVYAPVCGYSTTKGFRTFSNQCLLELQNECIFGDYVFTHLGQCTGFETDEKCNGNCPRDYNPVCGLSVSKGYYETFPNICEFAVTNRCKNGDYVFIHLGQCTRFETDERCNGNCPRDYNPVCGLSESKGCYGTFPNLCEFAVTNRCKNGDYSLDHLGECASQELDGGCNQECSLLYIGVCGYSKQKGFKTFPNVCFLDRENSFTLSDYKLAHLGKCTPTEIGKKCNCVCQDFFSPVCGRSLAGFKTFLNYCYLDRENSCNFADYRFIHIGECTPQEQCDNCQI